jgi:hypothetical protein
MTRCKICHKPLRDELSKLRGFGPVCWRKFMMTSYNTEQKIYGFCGSCGRWDKFMNKIGHLRICDNCLQEQQTTYVKKDR